MNIRSIYVRLIFWSTALVILVITAFGAFTWNNVQRRLYDEATETLRRRAQHIAEDISAMHGESPESLKKRIHDVYSPEESNRFIRIVQDNHDVLYQSGSPRDDSFNPAYVPLPPVSTAHTPESARRVDMAGGHHLLILAVVEKATDSPVIYSVEMGMPTDDIDNALHKLLLTLLLELPAVVIVAAFGNYVLLRRALQPVERMRAIAQEITFSNVRKRIPVERSGDELEHLAVTLNQMLDRLDQSYQQASRFSADAAHELRTPLTIIRSELETAIREPGLSLPLRERFASMLEEAEHLSRISEGLFAISRLDAGEAKVEHARLDLSELARLTVDQMMLLAHDRKIALIVEAPQPVYVDGDSTRLKQVIINLVDNALKYSLAGGKVVLRTDSTRSAARIEVRDNGIGIAQDALPQVFERFYRADKARTRSSHGAGLGLAIVRSICQAHGGTVRLASTEGQGTTVTVELPLGIVSV